MTKHELPKTYDFRSTEPRIYEMWESGGYFKPWNDPNKPDFDPNVEPFVIAIPPPNVTGELHIGHPMFVSIEDLMIRYHRMKGFSTLWIPGSDHAGIATQLMVERDLLKNEEVTRDELGREEFVKRTWDWKKKYGGIITNQIRRLGASCDWDRERFTLDPGLSRAVREAFVRLYEKGLIYRGPRLINWSQGLKTAVSDLEVEYNEEDATLYYFKYMLKDSDEFIPVATIRPETILGDTAVAVHPDVRARAREPAPLVRQLVPGRPHRARQRTGGGRRLLALRHAGRDARPGAVVFQDHGVRRRAARRDARHVRVARKGSDDAAELDRQVRRGAGEVRPGSGIGQHRSLYDEHRHDLRGDLRPARPGTPAGRRAGGAVEGPRVVPEAGPGVPGPGPCRAHER